MAEPQYQRLKHRHREIRDGYPKELNLRIHRALSWLDRAERSEDEDGKFIFLWIAFNAAYAAEIDEQERLSEQTMFNQFLAKLLSLDKEKRIDAFVWKEFSGNIRILLETQFVYQTFWDFHSGKITESEWKLGFDRSQEAARLALASGSSQILLATAFSRLYTLRNQLIHGGATWMSEVNRQQVRCCTGLLEKLVPIIIELMMENPQTTWGPVCYPVVEQ